MVKFTFLSIYLVCFQIVCVVLFALFADYDIKLSNEEVPTLYSMFMDVHTMMFIGFGFLMTFLKKYGYSSIGFNFLVAAYVLQWALIVRGLIKGIEHGNGKFELGIENLLVADFCSAAVLISFGAVIGKTSLMQLVAMATFEVIFQSINEYIGLDLLKAYDAGESMYVHVFGAYFGLAVSKFLHHKTVKSDEEGSNYNSDLFSMIGTLILWLFWPSFNSAVAEEEGQLRAVVNTYLSITASCITTFLVSSFVGKGKLNMVHIQNATLAGGVAIGAVADMKVTPFGAVIVGSVIGVISTFGFQYLTEFLNHKLKLHDTCGVNNLHGIPGLVSGIVSIIIAAVAQRDAYGGDRLYIFYPSRIPKINSEDYIKYDLGNSTLSDVQKGGMGRSAGDQALFQFAALAVTLAFALVTGALVGLFLRLPIFEQIQDDEDMFIDNEWSLPEDSDRKELLPPDNVENEFSHEKLNISL